MLIVIGFVVGFSPVIAFELKNHFYNFQTFLLYLHHPEVFRSSTTPPVHYMLSSSLFLLLLLLAVIRKVLTKGSVIGVSFALLTIDLFLYFPLPSHPFGMEHNWNYLYEKKAYELIRKEGIKEFNVANLIYNAKADVIKYLLKRDDLKIDYDNYTSNKYLYVLEDKDKDYRVDPAYEVHTFTPAVQVKKWSINNNYSLYLLKRK